jgi:mRNA-degrading endonuclease RelE of RelBE toxin-antitoxin system
MAYKLEFTDLAMSELKSIRAFDQRRIVDELERHLFYEPTLTTRNRKRLDTVSPEFEHVPPVWELRVGDYRVFYDVDEVSRTVYVRAVRRKGPQQTTEDIAR